jgi:hypothetical protein
VHRRPLRYGLLPPESRTQVLLYLKSRVAGGLNTMVIATQKLAVETLSALRPSQQKFHLIAVDADVP